MTAVSIPIRALVVPVSLDVPVYVVEAPAEGVAAVLGEVIDTADIDPMRFEVGSGSVVLYFDAISQEKGLPRNSRATALWHKLDSRAGYDELLGTVVLVGVGTSWSVPAVLSRADAEMWRSVPTTIVRWARALG